MAILIPSKNIYNKQNPKVRDNVIERIEVGAVEVVPNNEYETPVYNNKYEENGIKSTKEIDLQGEIYNLSGGTYSASACYVTLTPTYSNNIEIYIPIVSNNKYIDTLLLGVDKDGNENIKLRVVGDIIKRNATATMDYSGGTANMQISNITYSDEEIISEDETLNISSLKENYDLEYTFDLNAKSSHIIAEVNINQKELSINATYSWNATAKTSLKLNSLSNIYRIEKATPITIDNIEYYKLELKVLCGVEYDILAGNGFYYRDETHGSEIWGMKGVNYQYIPKQLEITVYGTTIGIDLTDKTVYINGETAKKVHSVDGNELMQTSNYTETSDISLLGVEVEYYYEGTTLYGRIKRKNESLINVDITVIANLIYDKEVVNTKEFTIKSGEEKSLGTRLIGDGHTIEIISGKLNSVQSMFLKTKSIYQKGKETATIRCDISDYYEYNATADKFKGEKMIAIDNSTGEMYFKLYDQVIPMVYGADGQDHPMSLYQDGTPKVFQVLGSNIYYDGAVWQELSLQEVDKN